VTNSVKLFTFGSFSSDDK